MTRTLLWIGTVGILATSFGCTTMDLKDIGSDMPKRLVAQYRGETGEYADEGLTWVPFLLMSIGKVSVTEDGFAAVEITTLGPLGLVMATGARTYYDSEGRLLFYASAAGPLWSLLFDVKHRLEAVEGGWAEGHSFRLLKGLLGYEIRTDGAVIGYFLWFPIPLMSGRGEGGDSGTQHPTDGD